MSGGRLTRRRVVAGAALGAAGGLGLRLGIPAPAGAQGRADVSAIAGSVRLQQALGVAYAAMARRPRLGREVRDLLGHLADHERQHAAALLVVAEYVGVTPTPAPTVVRVEAALPAVAAAVDRPTALAALDELERAELLGFFTYQQIIGDAKIVQIIGAVMCSDAQHLALVRQAAGLDPIPSAFEAGRAR